MTMAACNSLGSMLRDAIVRLQAAQVGSPRLNAETLLMFTLGCDRAYLYAHGEREMTADELRRYEEALAERACGVPSQYITCHQEFWGMDLLVSPAVLIPRPETEHVVETVLELSGHREGLKIADVGTGSGCIALAIAKDLPTAEILALEISAAALEIARANASRHQLETRIQFRCVNLLDGMEPATWDFVVSNPPYIPETERESVEAQVRKFEPEGALFAGRDGMDIYRRLIPQAKEVLKPGGWLVMEIGFGAENRVRALLDGWAEVRLKDDLQGIPRVVAARK